MTRSTTAAWVAVAVAMSAMILAGADALSDSEIREWGGNLSQALDQFREDVLTASEVQALILDGDYRSVSPADLDINDAELISTEIVSALGPYSAALTALGADTRSVYGGDNPSSVFATVGAGVLAAIRAGGPPPGASDDGDDDDDFDDWMTTSPPPVGSACPPVFDLADPSSWAEAVGEAVIAPDARYGANSTFGAAAMLRPHVNGTSATDGGSTCLLSALEATMAGVAARLGAQVKRQFVLAADGTFAVYPGVAVEAGTPLAETVLEPLLGNGARSLDAFDAVWSHSATAGPKDVVIVVDATRALGSSQWFRVREAFAAVLTTLSSRDYVNLVIAQDNVLPLIASCNAIDADVSDTFSIGSTSNSQDALLFKATETNKESMLAVFDQVVIESTGQAVVGDALAAAFRMLSNSSATGHASGCQQVLMFITDEDTFGGEEADEALLERVSELAANEATVVSFVYSVGVSEDGARTLRRLACRTSGVLVRLDDASQLAAAMRSYGTVLGRGRRLTTTEWLPMEDDGTDLVLRLVESVWDDAPGEGLPVLVGVVGMDVAIQSLVDSISFFETGERYAFLIDRAGVVVVHPQLIPKVGFGREPLRVDMTTIETDPEFVAARQEVLSGVSACMGPTAGGKMYCYQALAGELPVVLVVVKEIAKANNVFADEDFERGPTLYYNGFAHYDDATKAMLDIRVGENGTYYAGLDVLFGHAGCLVGVGAFERPLSLALRDRQRNQVEFTAHMHDLINGGNGTLPDMAVDSRALADMRLISNIAPRLVETWNATTVANLLYIYFGSAHGGMVSVPDTVAAKSYDPRARAWYQTAVQYTGVALSTPYADFTTGTKVITVAATVFYPDSRGDVSSKIAGVVGADVGYTELLDFVGQYLPCEGSNRCWVMDEHGFMIMYDSFATAVLETDFNDVFVGNVEPNLFDAFLEQGILLPTPVANLAEYADCTAYRVDTTVFADGPATGGLGECRDGDWYMTPIEGTNVFLIGVAGYSILSICDTKNPVCIPREAPVCDDAVLFANYKCAVSPLDGRDLAMIRDSDDLCVIAELPLPVKFSHGCIHGPVFGAFGLVVAVLIFILNHTPLVVIVLWRRKWRGARYSQADINVIGVANLIGGGLGVSYWVWKECLLASDTVTILSSTAGPLAFFVGALLVGGQDDDLNVGNLVEQSEAEERTLRLLDMGKSLAGRLANDTGGVSGGVVLVSSTASSGSSGSAAGSSAAGSGGSAGSGTSATSPSGNSSTSSASTSS